MSESLSDRVVTQLTELPDENKVESSREIMSVAISSQFSGPIPPPDILRGYEEICPGAAMRILAMAEKEQQHRHEGDRRVLFSTPQIFKRGQLFAFAISILSIGGGVLLGMSGYREVAIALAAGPPIILAGGFIGWKIRNTTVKENE